MICIVLAVAGLGLTLALLMIGGAALFVYYGFDDDVRVLATGRADSHGRRNSGFRILEGITMKKFEIKWTDEDGKKRNVSVKGDENMAPAMCAREALRMGWQRQTTGQWVD